MDGEPRTIQFVVQPGRTSSVMSRNHGARVNWRTDNAGAALQDLARKLSTGQGADRVFGYMHTINTQGMSTPIWSAGADFWDTDGKTSLVNTPVFIDALQQQMDMTLKDKSTPVPAEAAMLRRIQRAVPRSSASRPNTDVCTSRLTRSPVTALALVTLTRSLNTVAAVA